MAERKPPQRADAPSRTAQPAGRVSGRGRAVPGSQGTDAVRGTWSSEGEAGHHPPIPTQPQKTSSFATERSYLDWLATQAKTYPDMTFTTLAHRLDVAMLERAFWRLNPRSSPGIDRQTWRAYRSGLKPHLEDLHERLVQGTYRPQPVVRQWISKGEGKFRPLGITALEDKIVQRAVAFLLEAIYEQDFYPFSFGFRPGLSCHKALHALREGMLRGIHIVLDCDVSAFFDNLDHDKLLAILRRRINDGRILALIEMWLKAGIMDGQDLVFPEKGSPQGSVISPLLANVYLHAVLDDWFVKEVMPRCRGRVVIYRYADDFVIGCEFARDADKITEVLPKRFGRYGLETNREKTRRVNFRRPRWGYDRKKHGPKPGTFDFLGFTIYWGKTWKGGHTIKFKTAKKRMFRAVRNLWEWCRANRHRPLEDQYQVLYAKLRGHYQYYGLRCNSRCLEWVYEQLKRMWRYWLNRRGGRKKLTWAKYARLLERFPLPRPRITQSGV